MFNKGILLVFIIVFLISCSDNKEPVLIIGKTSDNESITITKETENFMINDNLAYILTTEIPFNTSKITRRIYKGQVYRDLVNRESIDLEITPDTTQIRDIINIKDIVRKHGWGHFMLIFIINDTVIAKKSFIIEKSRSEAKSPVKQTVIVKKPEQITIVTEDKETEINSRPVISKPISPSVSPSEMMNE
ncbi:MAG: hypothetical protein JW864_15800 [Spirochaetes bacterium]|nr:hypothetical protein [Spirochaetota bacterium]